MTAYATPGGDQVVVKKTIHFARGRGKRKRIKEGREPKSPIGRLPRITKLMALAIRIDKLVRDGDVQDFAEVARLGHVTRARITQITNLLQLAPDLQEEILFLPRIESGRAPITERDLRAIVAELDWAKQRTLWKQLKSR